MGGTKRKNDLAEALDRAMHVWARRDREPAGIVESRMDALHVAWAAARFTNDGGLALDAPAVAADATEARRRRIACRRMTAPARKGKQAKAEVRAFKVRPVFKRLRRSCRSEWAAAVATAAELKAGGWSITPRTVVRIVRRPAR